MKRINNDNTQIKYKRLIKMKFQNKLYLVQQLDHKHLNSKHMTNSDTG